jgi:hypothetical protein
MELKTVLTLVGMVSDVDTIDWEEIEVDDEIITIQGTSYIVLNEDQVKERMDDHIRETASYFNTWFLANMTELDEEIFENLVEKNEAVYNLICKTCGINEFIEECLSTDGAGHFLNGYNGEEYELGEGLSAFNY